MSKKELVTITDIWFAACLTYLGYELAHITEVEPNRFSYAIQCAALDFDDLRQSYYEKGDMALTDARSFVNAFNVLVQHQKEARRNGTYTSSKWISGEIG